MGLLLGGGVLHNLLTNFGSFQLAKSITMSSAGDGVIYDIAVVGSCIGDAKT